MTQNPITEKQDVIEPRRVFLQILSPSSSEEVWAFRKDHGSTSPVKNLRQNLRPSPPPPTHVS